MTRRPLVIVGDTLLDRDIDGAADGLTADGPTTVVDDPVEHARPGGAGLTALIATREARPVVLVTALSSDESGERLKLGLELAGITVIDVGLAGATAEKVRIRSGGQMLLRVDHGSRLPAPTGPFNDAALLAMQGAAAVLVSDYGGRVAGSALFRESLAGLAADVPVVWDPHRHGGAPVRGTLLVTPNVGEAAHFSGESRAGSTAQLIAQGRTLVDRWQVAAVALTRSERGVLLVAARGSVMNVGVVPADGDSCGAGDSFAATVALLLAGGASVDDAVTAAARAASRFVADGGVAMFSSDTEMTGAGRTAPSPGFPAGEISVAAQRVRAAGGTVVATGGCFDLLHAGHLSVLRDARALGDCLIVCLNSDDSVRGLKGPGRPVVPLRDREAVLRALRWVDDVLVFDEPSPTRVLSRLRPDIWAKGGDYAVDDIPEAALVRGWGGQVVTLPHLAGHSTTRLLEQAVHERASSRRQPE